MLPRGDIFLPPWAKSRRPALVGPRPGSRVLMRAPRKRSTFRNVPGARRPAMLDETAGRGMNMKRTITLALMALISGPAAGCCCLCHEDPCPTPISTQYPPAPPCPPAGAAVDPCATPTLAPGATFAPTTEPAPGAYGAGIAGPYGQGARSPLAGYAAPAPQRQASSNAANSGGFMVRPVSSMFQRLRSWTQYALGGPAGSTTAP